MNRNPIRLKDMGSWRLNQFVSPPLQLLAAKLEGAWRHLTDDPDLYPIKPVCFCVALSNLAVQQSNKQNFILNRLQMNLMGMSAYWGCHFLGQATEDHSKEPLYILSWALFLVAV